MGRQLKLDVNNVGVSRAMNLTSAIDELGKFVFGIILNTLQFLEFYFFKRVKFGIFTRENY